MPKEFIVAIELGSSKMTGIAGQKNLDGSITVLATVEEDSSSCIRKGVIYNIDKQKNLTISKTDSNTSWGAAYAQFSQKAENITDNGSGIKVKREIISNKQQDALSCGDKIKVRITISADRDYDFVQITDKRAACLEPVNQLSGYQWGIGCYVSPRDHATNFYFDRLSKGKHIVEMEYYVDRKGDYQSGTCTVQCTYSPEFGGRTEAYELKVNN